MPADEIKQNLALIERLEQFLQTAYTENVDFNEAFSGEDLVVIRGLKDRDNQYQYMASEILYWVDRKLYLDELESWSGGLIKESHSEAIKHLTDTTQQPVFSDLVDLIRSRKIAPFLGAGVSKAAGYPLWSDALVEVSKRIAAVDEKQIDSLIVEGKYLEAAQRIYNCSEHQLNNYIQTTFRTGFDTEDERERIPKIFKLLSRISTGCIITTNFDRLIEEAFRLKGSPLVDGYMHGVQQGHNFVQQLLKGGRCILKLHGDASQPASYVFTQEQYEQAYGHPIDYSHQLPKALRQIYISNSLLFIGCSLDQDKTLELFKEVKDGAQFEIPDHFAIISSSGDLGKDQSTDDRLLDLKIRPIWYDPKDNHTMSTQLVELAADMAEKRVSLG